MKIYYFDFDLKRSKTSLPTPQGTRTVSPVLFIILMYLFKIFAILISE